MSVTADSTLWTADTICITADGRVICIDAVVAEPVGGQGPTADTTLYTADSIVLTADGGAVAGAIDTLDAAVEVIGGAIIPVDVVEAAAALDQLDADVFPEIVAVPGGAHYPRRRLLPVIGVGYGILSQLWGEAHGVVGVVGAGVGRLPGLVGEAAGSAGVVGRSAAQLHVRATAIGAGGTRGAGEGVILKFSGTATGRHDDDDAAVIAFLLAA